MPHNACDPVVAGAQIVSALQTIVARNADPIDRAVVSITQFHAGDADNVIPQTALLGGTARSFPPRCATSSSGASARSRRASARRWGSRSRRPTSAATRRRSTARRKPSCVGGGGAVVGEDKVDRDPAPVMGAEDFAFMLGGAPRQLRLHRQRRRRRGADGPPPTVQLQRRGAAYGASYWSKLVEQVLPVR